MNLIQFCWCVFFGSWAYFMIFTKWTRNGYWILKSLVAASISFGLTLIVYGFLSIFIWLGN